ncbi:hypothetical protein H4W30_000144 [Amycolatopsis roodepoortensis]|uniref:Uncharacterized protein n=1 Tax=Amycolatopsis roodepoortensis TaxID=700274 RepID=A0ABR9KXM7_9PSEU|nr:hypothetical protein [Amycolatopsis roodepoortensis]
MNGPFPANFARNGPFIAVGTTTPIGKQRMGDCGT